METEIPPSRFYFLFRKCKLARFLFILLAKKVGKCEVLFFDHFFGVVDFLVCSRVSGSYFLRSFVFKPFQGID